MSRAEARQRLRCGEQGHRHAGRDQEAKDAAALHARSIARPRRDRNSTTDVSRTSARQLPSMRRLLQTRLPGQQRRDRTGLYLETAGVLLFAWCLIPQRQLLPALHGTLPHDRSLASAIREQKLAMFPCAVAFSIALVKIRTFTALHSCSGSEAERVGRGKRPSGVVGASDGLASRRSWGKSRRLVHHAA